MPITEEAEKAPPVLATSREPVAPGKKNAADNKNVGEQALMDAIAMVLVCWAIVFLLAWSLRRHNI